MNKTVTDNVNTDTLYEVWNQRNARMKYRIRQAEANPSAYGFSKPNCNAALDKDCRDAYNKLIGAIRLTLREATLDLPSKTTKS